MRILPPGSECERRNPKKLKKVATSHSFDRLKGPIIIGAFRVSKNPGVVKGRLPLKLYSGSDGMHVRTDENL